MLNLIAPEFGHRELTDYGCAGRNLLDPFHSNIGKPVDLTNKALSRWKTCIRCAKERFKLNTEEMIKIIPNFAV